MLNSAPASATASHTARPYQESTAISQASSPEKEIRLALAGMPEARVMSRNSMNLKPSAEKSSSGASLLMTSRDLGPTTAMVAYCSVTEVANTSSSGHSVCNHSSIQSSTSAAPEVVVCMKYRSSARRRVTPSSKIMPSADSIGP